MRILSYRETIMVKVYLDNCCYNRPFDDQDQMRIHLETQAKLYIQELIKEQKLELVCSFVSRYENSVNPDTVQSVIICSRPMINLSKNIPETRLSYVIH
jgi:hypothetical protein